MKSNDNVQLYEYDETKTIIDEFGTRIPASPDLIDSYKGNVYPYTKELLLRNYGYEIKCTNIFFYYGTDKKMDVGLFLKYNSEFYKIVKVITCRKHMEVVIDSWELK